MKSASLRPFLPNPAIRRRSSHCLRRHYAFQTPSPPMLQVFNDSVKHLQRERAANDVDGSRRVDYLRDEVATRLSERLLVHSTLQPFPIVTTLILLLYSGYFPTFPPRPRSWRKRMQHCPSSYRACSTRLATTILPPFVPDIRRFLTHLAVP